MILLKYLLSNSKPNMFSDKVNNTTCPHGTKCMKWGCPRKHPEGRYIGFDCQHDQKCNQFNCHLHHTVPNQNHSIEQKAIAAAIMGFFIQGLSINKQVCRHHLNGTCSFGKNCFRRHIEPVRELEPTPPKEIVKKIRKTVTCSLCQQTGHNSRGCWTKKINDLPAPPNWL